MHFCPRQPVGGSGQPTGGGGAGPHQSDVCIFILRPQHGRNPLCGHLTRVVRRQNWHQIELVNRRHNWPLSRNCSQRQVGAMPTCRRARQVDLSELPGGALIIQIAGRAGFGMASRRRRNRAVGPNWSRKVVESRGNHRCLRRRCARRIRAGAEFPIQFNR